MDRVSYPEDTIIIQEGDTPTRAGIASEGLVQVELTDPSSVQLVAAQLRQGSFKALRRSSKPRCQHTQPHQSQFDEADASDGSDLELEKMVDDDRIRGGK